MRLQELNEMSARDLRDAEYVIEWLFKDLNLDVVWTTHFKQRAEGREADVTKQELIDMFNKLKQKYGNRLKIARDNHVTIKWVLHDLANDLNIPFTIDFDQENPWKNKYHLRGITILRKDPKEFRKNAEGGQDVWV